MRKIKGIISVFILLLMSGCSNPDKEKTEVSDSDMNNIDIVEVNDNVVINTEVEDMSFPMFKEDYNDEHVYNPVVLSIETPHVYYYVNSLEIDYVPGTYSGSVPAIYSRGYDYSLYKPQGYVYFASNNINVGVSVKYMLDENDLISYLNQYIYNSFVIDGVSQFYHVELTDKEIEDGVETFWRDETDDYVSVSAVVGVKTESGEILNGFISLKEVNGKQYIYLGASALSDLSLEDFIALKDVCKLDNDNKQTMYDCYDTSYHKLTSYGYPVEMEVSDIFNVNENDPLSITDVLWIHAGYEGQFYTFANSVHGTFLTYFAEKIPDTTIPVETYILEWSQCQEEDLVDARYVEDGDGNLWLTAERIGGLSRVESTSYFFATIKGEYLYIFDVIVPEGQNLELYKVFEENLKTLHFVTEEPLRECKIIYDHYFKYYKHILGYSSDEIYATIGSEKEYEAGFTPSTQPEATPTDAVVTEDNSTTGAMPSNTEETTEVIE